MQLLHLMTLSPSPNYCSMFISKTPGLQTLTPYKCPYNVSNSDTIQSFCYHSNKEALWLSGNALVSIKLNCNLVIMLILGAKQNERCNKMSIITKCTFWTCSIATSLSMSFGSRFSLLSTFLTIGHDCM